MTKTFSVLSLGLSLLALSTHVRAEETPLKEPLRINNIFVPQEGYDDNDNIEFVLDGELKNACFQVGSSSVSFDGNIIDVKLESSRKPDTFCIQDDAVLPVAIQAGVPFSKEVEIGALKAGEYTIRFQTPTATVTKTFKIAVSPSNRQDAMNYAPVSNASIESLINVGDVAKIRITGMLTSSCMTLRNDVLVTKENDVVVIQPLVKVDLSSTCLMYLRPFSKEVDVPNLAKGRYLAHIRSMNGQALNRVFSVCKQNADGNCPGLSDR
ncbi:MAG: hypothetical protein ABIR96_07755 [Bdellovibrionota bacterium]